MDPESKPWHPQLSDVSNPDACRFEERLEAADRRRAQGNEFFKGGDSAGAAAKYGLALSFLDEDFLMQLEGPHLDQACNNY